MIWAEAAATIIVLLPMMESRAGMAKVLKRISQKSTNELLVKDAYHPHDPPLVKKESW